MTFRLGHRPVFDGVRGTAILAVIAYHAGYLHGGYLGVDVFFVLSGFLITTVLLEEAQATGAISLRNFYARRALRLLPALTVVLVVWTVTIGVLAWAAGVSDLWGRALAPMVSDALIALFYVANWAMISGVSLYLFGHTWSLSIEEQFYLLWPLGLVALLRFVRAWRIILVLILAGIAASIAWRAILLSGGASVSRVFHGFDTRCDALLIGCAVAVAAVSGLLPGSSAAVRATRVAALTSITCLAVLFAVASWQSPVMLAGGAPLAAAGVAVVLVDVLIFPRGAIARALGWAPLVGVGKISYGLYLWHFPFLYAFSALSLDGGVRNPRAAIPALLLTFVVAGLSFRFMERPILELKERFSPARRPAS